MPSVDPTSIYSGYGTDAWAKFKQGQASDQDAATTLNQYGNQFIQLFKNYVGRDPGDNEVSQFFNTVVAPTGRYSDNQKLRDQTASFIGDTYQDAAKQQAQNELAGQEAQATQLSNIFRTQGAESVNKYRDSLLDFTQKLVERVRPNLITSMQAQGLLNTGGLNQAIAGQQQDFANQSAQQVADLQLQNDQQADAIKFGGQSAQYEFNKAQSMNRLPNLLAAGQQGLLNAYNTQSQQNLFAQQQAMQRALLASQNRKQSFGSVFGNSLAQSLGTSLGKVAYNSGESDEKTGASSALLLSSRNMKKNISQLSEREEDELYDRLMSMPMYEWQYNTEADTKAKHIGTMTQDALPEIVMPDGVHLSTVDYCGVLTLALKVQDRRYKKEALNG